MSLKNSYYKFKQIEKYKYIFSKMSTNSKDILTIDLKGFN